MKARMLATIALALLPGCAGARQYRPGPHHAGLRAAIYEHTPIATAPPKVQRMRRGYAIQPIRTGSDVTPNPPQPARDFVFPPRSNN